MVDMSKSMAKIYHKGQTNLLGEDYFGNHIERVAKEADRQCKENGFGELFALKSVIVAYLHDILEDTDCTKKTLQEVFPEEIVEAVEYITRGKNEGYQSYIRRVSSNDIAKAVKIADLTVNMGTSGFGELTEKDKMRLEKYKSSLEFLRDLSL